MKEVAEQQKRFNQRRRVKLALRNASFLIAMFVMIAALLNALGVFPAWVNNWITFALSVLTAGVVLTAVWPKKSTAEALADKMRRQASKSRQHTQ
jgi:fatty acid desaturase